LGYLAKTDRIDARALRDFADFLSRHRDRHKYITAPTDATREELAALMTRRRQLVDMRVQELNRLDMAGKRARRSIQSVIRVLAKQIEQIDREIQGHIDDHFESLATLARELAKFDRGLKGGQRVITGSFTRQSVREPARWEADFGPLGRVAIRFK